MRLATYRLNAFGHTATQSGRFGWIEPNGDLVDILEAYGWYCRHLKMPVAQAQAAAFSSLEELIRRSDSGQWALLEAVQEAWRDAAVTGDKRALSCIRPASSVQLLTPCRPQSFRDFYAFERHVKTCREKRGLGMVPEWYEFPVFYFSNAGSFCGPDDPVWAPVNCAELDFELEVACIIGKAGRNIAVQDADAHIAGYLVLNDWSARDIQRREMKVGLGPAKGKDFATSCGPWFVTPSELMDVAEPSDRGLRFRLEMSASVNGREVSRGNLGDIYYTFAEMIHHASRDAWLYPGDFIGSGTVGTGCILELGTDVQDWLQPGDRVALTVERLGTLCTPVVQSPK